MNERAERAILSHAEAYRLVEEARQMRAERDAAAERIERLAATVEELIATFRAVRDHLKRGDHGAIDTLYAALITPPDQETPPDDG